MIGDLYNTNNVVVGQAACLVAPPNTPLPDVSLPVLPAITPPATATTGGDPFSLTPWTAATLSTKAGVTGGGFNLSYSQLGTVYSTATPIPVTTPPLTAAILQTAIVTMLSTLGATTADVVVTGGPLTTVNKPYTITLSQRLQPGSWTVTSPGTGGIVGGPLSITSPVWRAIGGTDAGWSFVSNKTTQSIDIEEQSTPVMMTVTTQSLSVQGDMAEDVTPTLAMAYNMTTSHHAATAAFTGPPAIPARPEYRLLTPTDAPLQYAVALIMANRKGYPRWLYIPQATCLANATGAFRRASAKRMYTVDFTSICPINQIAILDFQNPHL